MFNMNCLKKKKFILISWKLQKDGDKRFCFALTLWPCPTQSRGQWKWYKTEVNKINACEQGRYEKFGWTVWCNSNVKVFAMQDSRPAGWTKTTHYLDPHDT